MTLLSGKEEDQDPTEDAKAFKHSEARDDRLRDRGAELEEKQKQVDKMLTMSQKFRDQMEVDRLNTWKAAKHQRRSRLEDLRNAREDAVEATREERAQKQRDHSEVWDRLEQVRDEKGEHKDDIRREAAVDRYKARPAGMAVPMNV